MKKPRISFSLASRVCSSQSGTFGQLVVRSCDFFLLKHAEQAVLAGFCVALGLLCAFDRTVENGHQLGAAAQSIHGAALDQRLQHPLVQQPQVDLFAEFDRSN